jgi:hypothetical protein
MGRERRGRVDDPTCVLLRERRRRSPIRPSGSRGGSSYNEEPAQNRKRQAVSDVEIRFGAEPSAVRPPFNPSCNRRTETTQSTAASSPESFDARRRRHWGERPTLTRTARKTCVARIPRRSECALEKPRRKAEEWLSRYGRVGALVRSAAASRAIARSSRASIRRTIVLDSLEEMTLSPDGFWFRCSST